MCLINSNDVHVEKTPSVLVRCAINRYENSFCSVTHFLQDTRLDLELYQQYQLKQSHKLGSTSALVCNLHYDTD